MNDQGEGWVLHEWDDALGDKFRMVDGPRPMGIGFLRATAETEWEWSPWTLTTLDAGKAIIGLVCEVRRLNALLDSEKRLRQIERARLKTTIDAARQAMMEPHGEWKDVREAKAIAACRAISEEIGE